ncbi:MAG: DUF692 domain-containing protein [Solirubrobacteraceae bacterium]
MTETKRSLGVGIGWREELATFIGGLDDLHFVEVVAESIDPNALIPRPLAALRARDVQVIPHGLRLSLGGAARPEPERLEHLGAVASALDSPLVSEHVAFVRAGSEAAAHLMPVPRTRAALEVLIENVEIAQAALPVPLALEHVAALIEWPEAEMDEATFLCELLAGTDAQLLLDVSNLYANSHNHGYDPVRFLDRLPLERIAYVHVGGGIERDGIYHDTHSDPVQPGALALVEELCIRTTPPGVLLERDDNFPHPDVTAGELDAIRAAVDTGTRQRARGHV